MKEKNMLQFVIDLSFVSVLSGEREDYTEEYYLVGYIAV
jgi:hypothetical protein